MLLVSLLLTSLLLQASPATAANLRCSCCLCLAVDYAIGDIITVVGVLWFPAVVMVFAVAGVSAVAVVSTVVNTSSTGVSTSSGVPCSSSFLCWCRSCCSYCTIDVPGILAVALTSAVAAIPILLAFCLLLMLLASLLFLAVPAVSSDAFGPAVPVFIYAVDVESLLWPPILTSLMLVDVF